MVEPSDSGAARRAAILDAATGVFLRYGFKKTSMDDLARAAGLSRQGLYLHFPTKDALFGEAVRRLVDGTREAGREALAREQLPVEERLLSAFEAMHAGAIGQAGSGHESELLETATRLIGPVALELEQGLVAEVAKVLRSTGVAARWKEAGVAGKELAEHLYTTSVGAKHGCLSPSAYRERMRVAVRVVCRGPR